MRLQASGFRLQVLGLVAACSSPAHHHAAPPTHPHPIPTTLPSEPPNLRTSEPPITHHWLKGNTHCHARPSGDSSTSLSDVIAWYRDHHYDFIVLTDHNRVTSIPDDTGGLLVIPGTELTYNPDDCEGPPPDDTHHCRIHVNLLGVTAHPEGRIEWAVRSSKQRVDQYQAAIDRAKEWGGLVQINHPQWHWGMTTDLLTDVAVRGATLVEIANAQFATWNAGDATHPSMEQIWDGVLTAGVNIWGVASDDAHDYDADGGGTYPAGGAWVMVDSADDTEDAVLAALAAGHFYGSTGVELARADVIDGSLTVTVAGDEEDTITFIGDGRVLAESQGHEASEPLNAASYVRAVVTRADGAKAWTQPMRK